MHHHNKTQCLDNNKKALLTAKKTDLQKTGKGTYCLLKKKTLTAFKKRLLHKTAAHKMTVDNLL